MRVTGWVHSPLRAVQDLLAASSVVNAGYGVRQKESSAS